MKIERTDNYVIHSYDTDLNGVLSLQSLTRFLQETAWLNAEDMDLGFDKFLQNDMAWVLFKQYIKMNKWPVWGDVIQLKTWPSKSDKLFCYREFEIYHNEELIGEVATSWLVIDIIKRRPLRTSRYYSKNLEVNEKMLYPEIIKEKMEPFESENPEFEQIVRVTDIDVNQHVNNACYTQWCLNSYDYEFLKTHRIVNIEQQFLLEARFGESIEIHHIKISENTHRHCIKRNGKVLFLLDLSWEEIF